MKLGELCKKISIEDVFYGGKALNKNDKEYDKVFDPAISSVVTDSRNAAQGSLFICLRGQIRRLMIISIKQSRRELRL